MGMQIRRCARTGVAGAAHRRELRRWLTASAPAVAALAAAVPGAGAATPRALRVSPTLERTATAQVHLELVKGAPLRALAGRAKRRSHGPRAPAVTAQPKGTLVAPGTLARFSAQASGSPRPAAHWQISVDGGQKWRNLAGARGTSLSFMALAGQNGDEFRAVFVNKRGRAWSAAALLQVISGESAPLIVTQPVSQTVEDGATVSFTALANGDPTPAVQWEISDDGGASWNDVAGGTQTTLAFTASSILTGDEFRAAFTNALGSTLSDVATLTVSGSVSSAPVITQQPEDQNGPTGQTVSFSAAASGTPAPSVQWEVSTNDGQSFSQIPGATSTTYSFTTTAGENLYEYEAVFTNSTGSAASEPAVLGVGYKLAQNWSGYDVTGTGFTAVSGSWTVPHLNCSAAAGSTFSSQWVGIDGDGSSTVEQDGTQADCSGSTASYGAWYEMYGDTQGGGTSACPGEYYCAVPLSNTSYPVSPGDVISATVGVAGTTWTLHIADSTASWTFTTTIAAPTPTPQQASAEWIVERPEDANGLTALADFGTVQFTNATATTSSGTHSIAALGGVPLEMIRSATDATLLASPSALDNTGGIFTDTWFAAS